MMPLCSAQGTLHEDVNEFLVVAQLQAMVFARKYILKEKTCPLLDLLYPAVCTDLDYLVNKEVLSLPRQSRVM